MSFVLMSVKKDDIQRVLDNSEISQKSMERALESVEASQRNMELLIEKMATSDAEPLCVPEVPEFTDEQKKQAAYALNLCTVSVSQIVEYNDLYILEQEYEAILNNLNLEEFPKDEALLNILKQLLDVITYFRIQEGDKALIEKEYQQKMKSAIWSAVPNLGLIVAGGNPWTMAVSLASQVGIGYMNYRKVKAQNNLDREKSEWQLQRSAMEQLNGLRRELFDTAWRLSEKYQFPDAYRLTERQIRQYNQILMDTDNLRKLERLEYMKDKFEAYPPFWYYMGNTANLLAQDPQFEGEDDVIKHYQAIAKESFEKYRAVNRRKLLREDQICASCTLELMEMKLKSGEYDVEEIHQLIEEAINASGDAPDVLQICAFSYLQLGELKKAASIFRALVNENYNIKVNAQFLSRIYVAIYIGANTPEESEWAENGYRILSYRVGSHILFPLPDRSNSEEENKALLDSFLQSQKDLLRKSCALIINQFQEKTKVAVNKIYPTCSDSVGNPDDFYLDSQLKPGLRWKQIVELTDTETWRKRYAERLLDVPFDTLLVKTLNDCYSAFWGFPVYSYLSSNNLAQEFCIGFTWRVHSKIQKAAEFYNQIWSEVKHECLRKESIIKLLEFDFDFFFDSSKGTESEFGRFRQLVDNGINNIQTMDDYTKTEMSLREWCNAYGIEYPETEVREHNLSQNRKADAPFSIFTKNADADTVMKRRLLMDEMMEEIQKYSDFICTRKKDTKLIFRDSSSASDFSYYEDRHKNSYRESTVAILTTNWTATDWLFTTEGLVRYSNGLLKSQEEAVAYQKIRLAHTNGQKLVLGIGKNEINDNKRFDIKRLYDLTQVLGEIIKKYSAMSTETENQSRVDGYYNFIRPEKSLSADDPFGVTASFEKTGQ